MNKCFRKLALALLPVLLPASLLARSAGAPAAHTGAPGDLVCTACHRTFALNEPGGSVRIEALNYTPDATQKVKVTLTHPASQRWGFQLTARLASNPTSQAGKLILNDTVRIRCTGDAEPPCASSAIEYVSHNANSTRNGANGTSSWEFDWEPPSGDVGDVIFYVAGNAADGSLTNTGDRIYTAQLRIQNEGQCGLTRAPRFRSVGNAATSAAAISFNTLVSLYGLDFGAAGAQRTADASVIRENKFPTQLSCVAVEIAGQRVPLTFVGFDQINAQVPTTTQTGPVNVRVILNPDRPNELRSDVGTLTLQNYSPAFFTFNGTSIASRSGASIIADPAVVPGARAARPGEIIELYGTGFGATNPVYQAGEIVPATTVPLSIPVLVTVGGTTLTAADVLYAGVAPGSISGLYQLNVRLPATLATGDIPIRVSIGGVMSPAGTTIPVRPAM